MRTLAEQLYAAMTARQWSVAKLLAESGLPCERSSLQRKLHGQQKLSTEECERLAEVLGVTIAWAPDDEARAS
jgi:transcriptional regulator with XRE-family HTH domain